MPEYPVVNPTHHMVPGLELAWPMTKMDVANGPAIGSRVIRDASQNRVDAIHLYSAGPGAGTNSLRHGKWGRYMDRGGADRAFWEVDATGKVPTDNTPFWTLSMHIAASPLGGETSNDVLLFGSLPQFAVSIDHLFGDPHLWYTIDGVPRHQGAHLDRLGHEPVHLVVHCRSDGGSGTLVTVHIDGILGSLEFIPISPAPLNILQLMGDGINDHDYVGHFWDCRYWSRDLSFQELNHLFHDPWAMYRPTPAPQGPDRPPTFRVADLKGTSAIVADGLRERVGVANLLGTSQLTVARSKVFQRIANLVGTSAFQGAGGNVGETGLSFVPHVGDGVTTEFEFLFGYLDEVHLRLFVDNVEQFLGEDWSIINPGTIDQKFVLVVPPPQGIVLVLFRVTPHPALWIRYSQGAPINERDTTEALQQGIYIGQELIDAVILGGPGIGGAYAGRIDL